MTDEVSSTFNVERLCALVSDGKRFFLGTLGDSSAVDSSSLMESLVVNSCEQFGH